MVSVLVSSLVLCLLVTLSPPAERKPRVWTQSSFEDFRKGRFEDNGANTYVSRKGRIQLVNRWDLNGDGILDLVFTNTHSHYEKLDAAIYWGNGRDFDDRRMSFVPNDGAQRTEAADLDGDGKFDFVVPNYTNGTWDGMDSYVYFGDWAALRRAKLGPGADVAPFLRRTTLPSRAAQAAAVGDLNRDGHPDVVFALSAGFWEYRAGGSHGAAYASPCRIYWGSSSGYQRDRFTDVEAAGASAVAIADLDQDGWPELVVANRERNGKFDVASFVYWGGKEGLSAARRSELPTRQVNAVKVADLDRDGYPEIVFANGMGPASYVYWNDHGKLTASRKTELPSSDARDCAVADLNGDGVPDIFVANHQVAGNPLTDSYLYWGGKDGFSAQNRQRFQTTGAWGVSTADLNRDGRVDLVVSNYEEHYSYDVPSHVYWNSPRGFSDSLRTALYTRGAVGNTVGDFDGDGHLDILFNTTAGGARGVGSGSVQVYWGSREGRFSPHRQLELPALDPYDWAAADLDDDGFVELLVANMDEVGRKLTENSIFWGGPDGIREERRSGVMGYTACGIGVADLDRDGYLDVVVYNRSTDPRLGIMIYWGGADGFVTAERTGLPNFGSGTPMIADLNGDGHLDLVALSRSADQTAVIYWGDGGRGYTADRSFPVPKSHGATGAEAADLNRDGFLDLILTRSIWQNDRRAPSFVYWGNAQGVFSAERRAEFETVGTQGVTVGDVNQDGLLDVVCPNYNSNQSRATLSRIFLGGPDGLSAKRMFELPTSSGTGSQIFDYNGDGYNDLLLICHRSEGDPTKIGVYGDHKTASFLYWGGPRGFDRERRLLIPTKGAHYDGGVDLGNIYDRSFQFGYVSSPFRYDGLAGERIDWRALEPHASRVRFQVRTAATEPDLKQAAWLGPGGPATYYEKSGTRLKTDPSHAWIQYRAVLVSPNGSVSPVLERVELSFR
jgi:hypothetical protein